MHTNSNCANFDFTGMTREQVEQKLIEAGLPAADRAIILRHYKQMVEMEEAKRGERESERGEGDS